jgi:prepilin-type N-terminal cleavage/methylation domain-containing protein
MKRQEGFSLIEVMIATAIFAVFIVTFVTGQGYNLFDSVEIREETKMAELAELKMSELTLNPPELRETLTSASAETKTFEDYPDYEWGLMIKKIKIPDISRIQGNEENQEQEDPMQAQVYEQVKKNMEELIWQVQVTIKHKPSGRVFDLSTWLYNDKANVGLQGF